MKTILIKSLPVAALSVALLTSCASPSASTSSSSESAAAPTTVSSCGMDVSVSSAPKRAIALEQGATEMMLALGLQNSMVGTSYLTDAIAPQFQSAYENVPVLAKEYPTTEQVRAANPDFVYSMRASGFASEAAGTRKDLAALDVPAYLSSNDCENQSLITKKVGFTQIFGEITDIAQIFDVSSRGDALVSKQKKTLASVKSAAKDVGSPSIVWLYSTVNGAPVVAGANGLAENLGALAGATNSFSDLNAQWTETSWDEIAQRNPDVIVVADLSRGLDGDSAADKIASLKSDSVTKNLAAVKDDHLVSIPATELDPSVRSIDALKTLSGKLTNFAEGTK